MNKQIDDNVNRRDYFRLRLPENEELLANIEGVTFLITEVAERSLELAETDVPHRNGQCSGVIQWGDGRQSRFSGRVGPVNKGRILLDVNGVTTADLVAEQRRLRSKYPEVLGGGGTAPTNDEVSS